MIAVIILVWKKNKFEERILIKFCFKLEKMLQKRFKCELQVMLMVYQSCSALLYFSGIVSCHPVKSHLMTNIEVEKPSTTNTDENVARPCHSSLEQTPKLSLRVSVKVN